MLLSLVYTEAGDFHEALNDELVVFARHVLLDVVRAKYMDSVHTGTYFKSSTVHRPSCKLRLLAVFCPVYQ